MVHEGATLTVMVSYLVALCHRAHEAWGLEQPPDMVTFAKKMLAAGAYLKEEYIPKQVLIECVVLYSIV